MKISVCVGSSCHLKGSREVIIRLQELIQENKLEDRIDLNAAFCMGNCVKGVSVLLGDELIPYVTPETVDDFFKERIIPLVD